MEQIFNYYKIDSFIKFNQILNNSIQSLIKGEDTNLVFNKLLDKLIEFTDSKYGIIGKIIYKENKFLIPISITNFFTNKHFEYSLKDLSFNLGKLRLLSSLINSNEPIYSNDVKNEKLYSGIPKNHPDIFTIFSYPFIINKNQYVIVLSNALKYDKNVSIFFDFFKEQFKSLFLIYKKNDLRNVKDFNYNENYDLFFDKLLQIQSELIIIIDKNFKIHKYSDKINEVFKIDTNLDFRGKDISNLSPYFYDIFINDFNELNKTTKVINFDNIGEIILRIDNFYLQSEKYFIIKLTPKKDNLILMNKIDSDAKTHLFNLASNEIRKPINEILEQTNSLEDKLIEYEKNCNETNKQKIELGNIQKSAQKILNILNETIDTKNITTKINFNKTKFYVVRMLNEILDDIKDVIKIKNIYFKVNCIETKIHTDKFWIKKAIKYLLINSIRHSCNNNINIDFKKNINENKIFFIIKDNGEGYSNEDLKFIENIKNSNNHSESLSIYNSIRSNILLSKKIIESLNGKLEIDSMQNHGTRYILSIPLYSALNIKGNIAVIFNSIEKILLFENLIFEINRDFGWKINVDTFIDGSLILEEQNINKYNIIFIETLIPMLDGYELCLKLKSKNLTNKLVSITNIDKLSDKITLPEKYNNIFDFNLDDNIKKSSLLNILLNLLK